MTDNEIIKALERMSEEDPEGFSTDILDLIRRQQKLLTTISDLIVENTYPGFDKKGKPVCIWNTDGYKKIENLLKAGDSNA